jgi:hypothetical protein
VPTSPGEAALGVGRSARGELPTCVPKRKDPAATTSIASTIHRDRGRRRPEVPLTGATGEEYPSSGWDPSLAFMSAASLAVWHPNRSLRRPSGPGSPGAGLTGRTAKDTQPRSGMSHESAFFGGASDPPTGVEGSRSVIEVRGDYPPVFAVIVHITRQHWCGAASASAEPVDCSALRAGRDGPPCVCPMLGRRLPARAPPKPPGHDRRQQAHEHARHQRRPLWGSPRPPATHGLGVEEDAATRRAAPRPRAPPQRLHDRPVLRAFPRRLCLVHHNQSLRWTESPGLTIRPGMAHPLAAAALGWMRRKTRFAPGHRRPRAAGTCVVEVGIVADADIDSARVNCRTRHRFRARSGWVGTLPRRSLWTMADLIAGACRGLVPRTPRQ